ncbi:c-type cytochrome [Flavobacterium amnicola]|uniref:C-type cytochrome n=1 Tax=Flavobacterium amnicola TaxID=2506422 RepID=A0A4Q1K575_9FLAO|nr:c-type cytochrome [Flavobacterium amnicola]RXR21043.1 c-type cytochrome [Flavobacterium amnicola]
MKKLVYIILIGLLISCKNKEEYKEPTEVNETSAQNPENLGKEIFEGKGVCYTCHKPEIKTVGPSIKDIAKLYKEKGGSIVNFLQEKSEPIVDPSQYATMKTNFAITKNLPKEELKALEAYMLSFSK